MLLRKKPPKSTNLVREKSTETERNSRPKIWRTSLQTVEIHWSSSGTSTYSSNKKKAKKQSFPKKKTFCTPWTSTTRKIWPDRSTTCSSTSRCPLWCAMCPHSWSARSPNSTLTEETLCASCVERNTLRLTNVIWHLQQLICYQCEPQICPYTYRLILPASKRWSAWLHCR